MIGYYSRRSKKMKVIAIKYGLNFENNKFSFGLETSTNKKLNRIFGIINGRQIEIYDFITSALTFFGYFDLRGRQRYYTVFVVDGVRYPITGSFASLPKTQIIEKNIKLMIANKFYTP